MNKHVLNNKLRAKNAHFGHSQWCMCNLWKPVVCDESDDVIMVSLERIHPWLVVITHTKCGEDRSGNVDWSTNDMQKSTIFIQN